MFSSTTVTDMLNYLSCNYNFDSVEAERITNGTDIHFRARRGKYTMIDYFENPEIKSAKQWLDRFIETFDKNYRLYNCAVNDPTYCEKSNRRNPYFINWYDTTKIKNVIFNNPATIVFWSDDTKTVVKCQNDEIFDPEKGLAMAISKKAFGNKGSYCNEIKKWTEKYEADDTVKINFDIKCSNEMTKVIINAQEAIRNMLCGNPFEE